MIAWNGMIMDATISAKMILGKYVDITHDVVSQHGCEYRNQYGCCYGYNQRVLEGIQEVHLIECFYKVVKRKTFDGKQPGERALDDITFLF